ncbi:MAG: DUF115 domain-containing protein [Treponema sp.]|jgi:hypothetical protein|nr:DUF115 domain-containing protein [Treponema sp.]
MNGPFWKKNLALLHSRYPGLAEELALNHSPEKTGETPETNREGPFRVENTGSPENPLPTLVYSGPEGDLSVHSRRDPVREGRRQAEAALEETGKEGTIILLGFGLGYTAEALARAEGPALIILERRTELFRLALKNRDLEDLLSPGRAIFVTGGGSGGIAGILALLEKRPAGKKPLILKNRVLVSLTAEDASWYAEAERRILTWHSKDEINTATLRRFGRRWTRNLGANLSSIRELPGVKHLAGLLKDRGIPVFLAAAGPSLNGAGDLLEEAARRCLTVAVDTSLRFFLHRGIEPDFAVSVDPQYWNALHVHRLKAPGTTLIAESAVYPPVLRYAGHQGREASGDPVFQRALFCQSLFPLGWFIEDRTDPKGALGAGGSVATTAWDFARLLGPEEIWIAGLDLGFPGFQSHFRGALFEENAHALSGRFCPVETLSVQSLESGFPFYAPSLEGGRVLTDRRLSLYAAWFENRLGQGGPAQSIRNRSLSPRGMAIPGLSPAEPEDLLALPLRRQEIDRILRETWRRIDGAFFAPPARMEREGRYGEALRSLVRGLEEIRDSSERAASAAGRGLKYPSLEKEREQLLQKLDGINRIIAESPVKEAAGFLFPPPAELERELSETEPLRRHLEFSFRLYRSLAEAAEFTLGVLGT